MKAKHICDLYDWKRIRMLKHVCDVNRHHGFVPVAVYAPYGGLDSRCYGDDEHYEWCGRLGPYYAKRLWEEARRRLEGREAGALAFDVVEASECFNTIRFRNRSEAIAYSSEFRRLLREIADGGEIKCFIGRVPSRQYPWNPEKRYDETVAPDTAERIPCSSPATRFISICHTVPKPSWEEVERFFVDLTEDDLAFANGAEYINRKPSGLDAELLDACARLDTEGVESLLRAGASPNAVSGSPIYNTAVSRVLESAFSGRMECSAAEDVSRRIIDALVAHGCDLDLCAYDSNTALHNSIHCSPEIVQYLLEKGADPNAVSWVGLGDEPSTALDHAGDDIAAYDDTSEYERMYDLLRKAGGKHFSELVPDFYED